MGGEQQLAIDQMMNQMSQREGQQQQLLGYMGTDYANQLQGLGAQGGWINSMFPYEQYNIEKPAQLKAQAQASALNRATAEESINAQRRAEAMGWVDRAMGWQGQLGGQYYGGQGDWLDYTGQRGAAELGGYDPSWLQYLGM